jgi:voltage-gated potassium channel
VRATLAPGRFRLLLLSLLVFIIGTTISARLEYGRIVEYTLLAVAVGITMVELRAPGQRRLVPTLVAACVIFMSVIDHAQQLRHWPLFASALVAVFAGIVVWLVYGSAMRSQRPVGDRIVGAVCVYVLIGLGFASVYETLDGVIPGSFRFLADTAWTAPSALRYRYFSFITLATVGYGDVTPATALAGTLASLEAIAGQLYIGITVARLVSLSLVERGGQGERSKPDP